ncbi:23 kDa jasmonate-induced protein-like [Typha angustifolia]|uniref:23 kDa jasmonate-induced protein-like n=1 Tax=Typha angustifolia TaxID=59011 RepID=UPI003C2DAC9F
MAYNVFGTPITTKTLERMSEYIGKTITRKDRAKVALDMKNAESKDVNARQFVEQLKERYGNGVATLCVIYNATGDPLTYITSHDYFGHIWHSPYPYKIENGQWGAFLHGKVAGATSGSNATVVYRGMNQAGNHCDWMLAWDNPWNRIIYSCKAYTEIREPNHFDSTVWGVISDKMERSSIHCEDVWNGCWSGVSIGDDTTTVYEGIMTLQDVANFAP